MWPNNHPIYTTKKGVVVYVSKGGKSQYNFKVKYQEPGKRVRTPKHIHLIIDLFMKRTGDSRLTNVLVEHIIGQVIRRVTASTTNPPRLQVFCPSEAAKFSTLDKYGEYSVEFLLVVTEMIMIQEKTNYPGGDMNLRLFQSFLRGADIFSVVSAATFRGRR